jgi:hypothetical protein
MTLGESGMRSGGGNGLFRRGRFFALARLRVKPPGGGSTAKKDFGRSGWQFEN